MKSQECEEGQLLMVEAGRPGAENLVIIAGHRRPGAQGEEPRPPPLKRVPGLD